MLDATQALTVLCELAPGPTPRAELDHRLALIAADLANNSVFRPGELPDTHFTRFVIIDDPRGELPSLLAWESNHDQHKESYLAEVARAVPSIDAIFECCLDYPMAGTADVDGWVAWMLSRTCRAGAFYTAYRGVPRSMIANDRRVHDAIREHLDGVDRVQLARLPRAEIQRRICEHLQDDCPDLDLTSDPDDDELRWLAGKIGAIALVLVLLPLVLVIALPWYLALRRKETTDIAAAYVRPVEVARGVRDIEDQVTQNQLTHLVDIKPGALRLATLWIVLKAIDIIARVYSVRGNLGGITTIHFARWVILRDRRLDGPRRHRLLFFSNYDGSWEGYLGEFIDRAAYGLTAVWSNTIGFPATEHLALAGARDEESFKQWTREHQIPTQVWWSGSPDATVQNIRDDIWIRRRVDRGLSDPELLAWLRKL